MYLVCVIYETAFFYSSVGLYTNILFFPSHSVLSITIGNALL